MSNNRSVALTETMSHLVAQHPFFAVYLYDQLNLVEDPTIPTARTDGMTIEVNPDWFGKLQLPERVFVMAHEVMHGIYQHMARGKGYQDRGFGPDMKPWNHTKYNYAADYVINDALGKAKVGRMPEGGLHRPDVTQDDLVDDVYCQIPDPPENPGGGHGGFDEHKDPDPNKPGPSEADVKRAITSAKNAAKAMGKLPASLERLVGEIVEPTQNWKDLLRTMITNSAGRDSSTWARPNRRRLATPPHIYWPGTTGFQTGGVAIVVDTSGSVSPEELKAFMGEMSGILSECKPEWCKVLWTDSKVAGVDDVDDMTDLTSLKAKGGGGTDMGAALRYMEEHDIVPETCVVLTDGYTPWGDEPDYEVIWGITTPKIEADYGKSLHIDVR